MGEHQLELHRTGRSEALYDFAGAEIWTLPLLPVFFVVNLLVNLLVFRGGWTIHVYAANGGYRKIRYRSKKAAKADLEHQRELASTIPAPPEPEPPARLPTRGGSLRRPR